MESKGRVGRPKMWGKLALSFFTINRNPGDKMLLKVVYLDFNVLVLRCVIVGGITRPLRFWVVFFPFFSFSQFLKKAEKGTIIGGSMGYTCDIS